MSAAVASASAAALSHFTSNNRNHNNHNNHNYHNHNYHNRIISNDNGNSLLLIVPPLSLGRYESLKRRDWDAFRHYLRSHDPPLEVTCFGEAHVLAYLAHAPHPSRALVARLRSAFQDHAGPRVPNPFASRAVRLYLTDPEAGNGNGDGNGDGNGRVEEPQAQQKGKEGRGRGVGAMFFAAAGCFRS